MKIENSVSPLPASATKESPRASVDKTADNRPVPATMTEEVGTSVSLGSTAQLRSLGSSASAPQVDANKVAEIKKAISEGRFQVNSGVVADRLLSSVRDLIDASRH